MEQVSAFSLPGAQGQMIEGDTHEPGGDPRGVMLLCHGFKGYKDYGFIPYLAHEAAARGLIVHRFNFSHSGMTRNTETFERPDLFERDTWSRQVADVLAVAAAVEAGTLRGKGLTATWFGHSRGGVTVLLAASRQSQPVRIVAAAAPAQACSMDEATRGQLLADGFIESPSMRTNQSLRVGKAWLQEVLDDPEGHDPLRAAATLAGPMLIVHGDADATVDVEAARRYAQAAGQRVTLRIIAGGNHVFNGRNPHRWDEPATPQLREMVEATIDFALADA